MDYRNLQELTGQKMGIVVYDEKQLYVCNWTQVCPNGGLPRPFGEGLRPNENGVHIQEVESGMHLDDIRSMLQELINSDGRYVPSSGISEPLYERIVNHIMEYRNDLLELISSTKPENAMIYTVKCYGLDAKVIAPVSWKE